MLEIKKESRLEAGFLFNIEIPFSKIVLTADMGHLVFALSYNKKAVYH
jgi:hypothetical protein